MEFLSHIPFAVYFNIYYIVVLLLCLGTIIKYLPSNTNTILCHRATFPLSSIIMAVAIAFYLSWTPYNAEGNNDMAMYQYGYYNIYASGGQAEFDLKGEWLWPFLNHLCYRAGFSFRTFFLFVELIYVGSMAFCSWKVCRGNCWIAFLFCLASFSFVGYGANGIRNGLACSFVLVALVLCVNRNWLQFGVGLLLLFLAIGIHRSSMLPSVAILVSLFVVRKPKYAICFWMFSIILSLLIGNAIGNLFVSLGFDDRMTNYFMVQSNSQSMAQFSSTGFRWDFLLYSAVPVLWTGYLTVKRNFNDRIFNVIASTYILSNAFWIMVIRAAFSNRFAYLSWFMYPLVIAYPLLRFNIWDDQDKKTALILLLYEAFTFGMSLL